MSPLFLRSCVVGLLFTLACGPDLAQSPPGPGRRDAGSVVANADTDAGADAGAGDAEPLADAGIDEVPVTDAGGIEEPDPVDAGISPVDAGGPRDAGSPRDAGECAEGSYSGEILSLRAVAANLTTVDGTYNYGHGQNILKGLTPDIVMIQEFKTGATNSEAEVSAFANSLSTSGTMYWSRGRYGDIPNGVISRWPILASGDWTDPEVGNRGFTWAKIDLPGPRDLWVISVHLLTKGASYRSSEARALLSKVNSEIPAADFMLLGGDFNTDSRTEAAVTTLSARFVTSSPYPADQNGVQGTNAARQKPYDWVMASKCLNALKKPVSMGANSFANGLVVDTRVYSPVGDLSPALKGDSGANAMQHMAVVKDFAFEQ